MTDSSIPSPGGTTSAPADVQGNAAAGSAVSGNPVMVGGSDGTNAQSMATDKLGNVCTTDPTGSAWSITNTSAAAAQATASKAAGAAGIRHVCNMICGQLVGDATGNADQATINLRDGATGAGTVLASFKVSLATGANGVGVPFSIPGFWVGTAATAMTIEMSAAGATHTIGIVNASGYDTK